MNDETNKQVQQIWNNTTLKPLFAAAIGFARSKVPEQDAQDIVQDALSVLCSYPNPIANPKAFLLKVTHNKIRQHYDKHARRAGIVGALLPLDEQLVSTLSTRLSIRVARDNDLEAAMQTLNMRQHRAFELRYRWDLDLATIADVLDISVATVKRDVEQARAHLAGILGEKTEDAELVRMVSSYLDG